MYQGKKREREREREGERERERERETETEIERGKRNFENFVGDVKVSLNF